MRHVANGQSARTAAGPTTAAAAWRADRPFLLPTRRYPLLPIRDDVIVTASPINVLTQRILQ